MKMRGEPTTIGMADLETYPFKFVLSGGCHLSDRLTASFGPRHARWYSGISFEIRSMGSSIATSWKLWVWNVFLCLSLGRQ